MQSDGQSLRVHLEGVERQTGRRPAQLDGPECPELLEGAWRDFLEVSGRRGSGAHGPVPLTWMDLDAWARLTRRAVAPQLVRLLCRLDDVWLESLQKEKP